MCLIVSSHQTVIIRIKSLGGPQQCFPIPCCVLGVEDTGPIVKILLLGVGSMEEEEEEYGGSVVTVCRKHNVVVRVWSSKTVPWFTVMGSSCE